MRNLPERGSGLYLFLIAATAALGGLLFGYDTAVISGAVGPIREHFHLGAGLQGLAASSMLIGCIFGAMLAGPLGDAFGRKPVLFACALLFAASGVAAALPRVLNEFLAARFAGGLAIGAVSILSPLYIAEVSPERIRGRLVALYQLAIVLGILLVFFVNLEIQRLGDEAWNVAYGWRWMMGSLAVPSILFWFFLLPVPESPRWLLKAGRREEAGAILARVGGRETALGEIERIQESLAEERGTVLDLLRAGYVQPLVVGVGLAAVCQLSGINAIMYYAPEIFKSVGAGSDSAYSDTVVIGVVNVLFTFVAIAYVDRAGRRALLLAGSAVQVVALGGVGAMFALGIGGYPLLACILLFVAAFAVAMGPIPWIVISEIFPTRFRGSAMSVAVFVLWLSDYVVTQTFPVLREAIGGAATFWIYAACSLAGLAFVAAVVPETKGRTLEEIEKSWRARGRTEASPQPQAG